MLESGGHHVPGHGAHPRGRGEQLRHHRLQGSLHQGQNKINISGIITYINAKGLLEFNIYKRSTRSGLR
jgi:hypothetical protein